MQPSSVAAEEQGRQQLATGRKPALSRSSTKPARKPASVNVSRGHLSDEGYDEEYVDGGLTPTARRLPARQGNPSTSSRSIPQLSKHIPTFSSRGYESSYSNATASIASTASSISNASNARERSPAKTLAHLMLLDKLVTYNDNHDDVRDNITDDVHEL